MSRILALAGGGEFTPGMVPADQFLLSRLASPRVAILPTAAGRESDYRKWIESGVAHFSSLGAETAGIDLIDPASAADAGVLAQLAEFNFYYFSGGDPDHLLHVLKDSPAWQLIFSRYQSGQAVLAGSSAGAMVMGKLLWAKVYAYIDHARLLPWEAGLGLVDFGILPHYDTIQHDFTPDQTAKMQSVAPPDLELVGIDEGTAYINIDGVWTTYGAGQVHRPAGFSPGVQ